MSRGARQTAAVCTALVLCLVVTVAAGPPVSAQAPGDVTVSFSRIDATPGAAGGVTVVVEITNSTPSALTTVSGTLRAGPRLTSRLALHRALGDPSLRRPVDAADGATPLATTTGSRVERAGPVVPAGSSRLLVIETTLAEIGLPDAAAREAVYPLQVTVQDNGREIGRLTTALIVMPEEVEAPLQGGVLVRIDADLDQTPLVDGAVTAVADDTADLASLTSADQLTRLAAALTVAPVPMSVALDNALARAVPEVDGMAQLLERTDVERVLLPYAGADLVALRRGDLTDLADRELELGAAAWPGTQTAVDRAIAAPGSPVDAATVDSVLAPFGVEALVVGEDQLMIPDDRPLPMSPAPVRRLVTHRGAGEGGAGEGGAGEGGTGTALQALVPDPWIDELLATGPLDLGTVQRVLAETAVIYLERPTAAAVRGAVLRIPGQARPAGIEALLSALGAASWVEPVTLDALRTTVPTAGTARLDDDAAAAAALPEAYIADLAVAGASLTAMQGVLTETRDGVDELRDDLLIAASADFRDAPEAGRRLMDDVRESAADVLGAVAVVGEPTITFTDSVGQLPVVLANGAPVPLRVRVELTSQRLTFPTPDLEVELAADTTTTVLVDTEARTPGGTAPVDVVVTDPTGSRRLASGTLVVRIAAYPLLALLLVGVSALLLVLWWVRDLRRRRRVTAEAR